MSKWRVKGYVQDSDAEEEDIELSSLNSNQESQRSAAVSDGNTTARNGDNREQHTKEDEHAGAEGRERPEDRSTPLGSRLQDDRHSMHTESSGMTQTVEDAPRIHVVTPSTIVPGILKLREPTESPDPLLGSPIPKPNQVNERFWSSQILGASHTLRDTGNPGEHEEDSRRREFPLLIDTSDSELSDPPSELEDLQPDGIFFDPPTRKTTVQVVIPRTNTIQELQLPISERHVERSFRERKPIQLHPYLLEGERYRRDLQGRGIRPVKRVLSPTPNVRTGHQESQEHEFDPSNDITPSSPLEIHITTPTMRRRSESDHGSSVQRKRSQVHGIKATASAHRSTNSKKSDQPSRSKLINREESILRKSISNADLWIVPQSPPYSSSPMNHVQPAFGQVRRLPTPSNSSALLPPLDMDSDNEPVVHSVQRSGQTARRPIVVSDSSPSDTESSGRETQLSDHELRKVGRRIKGVLPASWLRLDRQAQENRNKQLRDRLNSLEYPERTEPQRGVAQRITRRRDTPPQTEPSSPSSNRIINISDGSDVETGVPVSKITDAQQLAHAAHDTVAILDERYADDDSDTMENNRLHLFTLGGSKKKRKVQSKLTDRFATSKKRRVHREGGNKSTLSALKGHTGLRNVRRTPPSALSILDVDQSPSDNQAMPQFLRIARRQARHRPDHARQSPTNKYIRLHTARDTEDAKATLRQWRCGTIKPKTHLGQPKGDITSRVPLTDLDLNDQKPLRIPGGTPSPKEQPQVPSFGGLRTLSRRPHFQEIVTQRAKDTKPHHGSSSSRNKPFSSRKSTMPFRNAQLEALAPDDIGNDRRLAFERGLQRVDRQFNLQNALLLPSRNPRIDRFLFDEDVTPALLSVEDVQEVKPKAASPNHVPKKRFFKRKPQAQRVDVEMRIFRQPSEPLANDYLKAVPILPTPDLQQDKAIHSSLQGLGPYGTRYPTTFDVSPLKDGTYFHTSTFVGSGGLHRALVSVGSNSRNLDETAGYCTVEFITTSFRCGPWEDDVSAQLANASNDIWNALPCTSESDEHNSLPHTHFEKATRVILSLVDYISTYLSFHDPIDRKSFVSKTGSWATSCFETIASYRFSEVKSDSTMKAKPLALLLVLCTQLRKIAQHATVEPSAATTLGELMRRISKSLVGILLDQITNLGDFLENNKRFQVRENGITNADVVVESLVICMHILATANSPEISFWELVSQSLSPAAKRANHLAEFEAVWGTVFTLLPFIELNDLGIPTRSRRTSFEEDNWTVIRTLVSRLFALYPDTAKANGASLNDYVRAVLTRCHGLIHYWNWKRCEQILCAMFDFFVAKNNLMHLQKEQCIGSATFLEQVDDRLFSRIEPNEKSFHIFLKCLFIGIQGIQTRSSEKKLRSVVLRLIPNHGRGYPKDQPLEMKSLDALKNHHDIMCTLYRASPPPCRPRLEQIKNLVNHENFHREACRIGIRTWSNLATFQLSTNEPYTNVRPLAEWLQEILMQTLKQYRVAKTEAEEYVNSGCFQDSEASSLMAQQYMEKNQDQVIAALRDCIGGMLKAFGVRNSQVMLKEFLLDSKLVHLFELPHLQDHRLIVVIRDALGVLRAFASLPRQTPNETIIVEQSGESQDYGEPFELDDLMEIDQGLPQSDDFLQIPLWRLLSNAFGAETSPDDNLLVDCIESWCLVARSQVLLGARSWTFYLNQYSQMSWQQLRRTEQSQKFWPYFMASILLCDHSAYTQQRITFLSALLISLVDRESMLRFQHRLLSAIIQASAEEPLLRNLPFSEIAGMGTVDINAETLRTRRLAVISQILSNMRDDFYNIIYEDPRRVTEVRGNYVEMLKAFMNAMKTNYQQLGSGATVIGAYVEFVQKVVQFLQQYTADIHPVLDFFTNSVAFPLPAADPTYVVGRLGGYAPKLYRPGVAKQLSVFVQTVAQQAATGNHQPYFVHQLQTALGTDESPSRDQVALRDVFLQGIFPAYIEAAFASPIGLVIAQPILRSIVPILRSMFYDIRVFDEANVRNVCDCLLAVAHGFIRSTEYLKVDRDAMKSLHILHVLSDMFQIAVPISMLLQYVCSRCSVSPIKPLITSYFEKLASFVGEALHGTDSRVIPSYGGDADATQGRYDALMSFSAEELRSGIGTNWSCNGESIWFGHGHGRREVMFEWNTIDVEKENLVMAIESFLSYASGLDDEAVHGDNHVRDEYVGDIDV